MEGIFGPLIKWPRRNKESSSAVSTKNKAENEIRKNVLYIYLEVGLYGMYVFVVVYI